MSVLKIWVTRMLLAFVFITIGFSIGRRTAPVLSENVFVENKERSSESEEKKVIVYAAHMTFRCSDCNQIEWLTADLINSEFEDELESGLLEFISLDYMQNSDFALRYDVSSSTVVVVQFNNEGEKGFERLDLVWTKLRNRDDFMDYVRKAIVSALYGDDVI